MSRSKFLLGLLGCLALFFSVPLLSALLLQLCHLQQEPALTDNQEAFRRFEIAAEHIEQMKDGSEADYKRLTASFLYYDGAFSKEREMLGAFSWYTLLLPQKQEKEYREGFRVLLSDLFYFPVSVEEKAGEYVRYENSWGNGRSYGGKRTHEGTDIMPSVQESGHFPILSVSDGVVEKKGWLELGGYRLGIRAGQGAYFYYAHMAEYAEGIEEGSTVKAGQIIGTMGNTGYGPEGTTGQFDVHLHFGVYMKLGEKEVSVNPYELLRYLERNGLHRK